MPPTARSVPGRCRPRRSGWRRLQRTLPARFNNASWHSGASICTRCLEQARREYKHIWLLLGDRTIEDLVDLPLMQDQEALATLDLLNSLSVPALYVDANLGALTLCRAVNLSLEHGNTDAAPANYAGIGLMASGH